MWAFVSESLRSLTKNERMSESLIFLSELLIHSFLDKKRAIRSENRWAKSQPCRALCDEIFDHFPLFDKTLHHIEFAIALTVKYSEIHQNFSNSEAVSPPPPSLTPHIIADCHMRTKKPIQEQEKNSGKLESHLQEDYSTTFFWQFFLFKFAEMSEFKHARKNIYRLCETQQFLLDSVRPGAEK